jgi:hypothetical protein
MVQARGAISGAENTGGPPRLRRRPVDGDFVFWSESKTGLIRRLAKPPL